MQNKAQTPCSLGFFWCIEKCGGNWKPGKVWNHDYKKYSVFVVIFHKNDCAVLTKKIRKVVIQNDEVFDSWFGMWITLFRMSKSYHSSLKRTRGKYENQTSGNVLRKREEMSKGQSNKTERNKTDFSNTNRILSVVCRNYTTVDWMG